MYQAVRFGLVATGATDTRDKRARRLYARRWQAVLMRDHAAKALDDTQQKQREHEPSRGRGSEYRQNREQCSGPASDLGASTAREGRASRDAAVLMTKMHMFDEEMLVEYDSGAVHACLPLTPAGKDGAYTTSRPLKGLHTPGVTVQIREVGTETALYATPPLGHMRQRAKEAKAEAPSGS